MKVTCTGAKADTALLRPPVPGCGREVEEPRGDAPWLWDVFTDADGNIVRRGLSVVCPDCSVATEVWEDVDPVPYAEVEAFVALRDAFHAERAGPFGVRGDARGTVTT